MKPTTKIVRILLGLMMLVFGLNGFFLFMPNPPANEAMGSYLGALAATGFMFPLYISLTEALAGILLLVNRFTPLVLIFLFTVLLNAFLAHLFLDPQSIGTAAFALP